MTDSILLVLSYPVPSGYSVSSGITPFTAGVSFSYLTGSTSGLRYSLSRCKSFWMEHAGPFQLNPSSLSKAFRFPIEILYPADESSDYIFELLRVSLRVKPPLTA